MEKKIKEKIFKLSFRKNIRNYMLLIAIIFIGIFFTIANPIFLSFDNFMIMFSNIGTLSCAAIAMSLIILTGGIDLSIGSSLAFAGVIAALVLNATDNMFLGMLTALLITSIVGIINGFAIGKAKLNAVVFTLGMMQMLRSLAYVISNNQPIRITNEAFAFLGYNKIELSNGNEIPIMLFAMIMIYIIAFIFLKYNIFGRRVKLLGGNPKAAKICGIPVENYTIYIYMIAGAIIGLCTIIDVGRVKSVHQWSGLGLEFDAITAVVIGGASMTGGKLDILGTFLGVILLGIVLSGLSLMNVPVYFNGVIKGMLLLAAILINRYMSKKMES
jgi:ribose transport system permease protein